VIKSDKAERVIALVVDDSPETLSVLTDALEEAGITVLVARDGRTALDLVGRIEPDVVLLDAVMPGLDGFETCRQLKQDRRFTHVPVIFMTGLSETENIVNGLRAGGVDYVTKPIAPDELIARISVHLANARLAQSARDALDAAGRSLAAVTAEGAFVWSTPRATTILLSVFPDYSSGAFEAPESVRRWLRPYLDGRAASHEPLKLPMADGGVAKLSFVGRTGRNEFLLRLAEDGGVPDEQLLQKTLPLTLREAEVLLWISQGKSNRDIAQILGLSPRTINKHLEQIFTKLGVENRTAAAALAIRTLAET